MFDLVSRFHHSIGTEGPAGAASALSLDRVDGTMVSPVHTGSKIAIIKDGRVNFLLRQKIEASELINFRLGHG